MRFITLILITIFSTGLVVKNKKDRPNVLFVVFDDLNDYVGCYNMHPQTSTPNLDKLASEGVKFMNAHSNAVWCAPSRTSMLSGYYPHSTGLFGLASIRNSKTHSSVKTLFQHFHDHEYLTFGTGKLFHGGLGEEKEVWTQFGNKPYYGPFPGQEGELMVHPDLPNQFTEKTFQENFFSFGRLSSLSKKDGINNWYSDPTPWKPSNTKPFLYKSEEDRDLMCDELSAEFAVNVLSQKHEKPFMLAVGFVRPHTPYYVPDQYFEMFDSMDIQLPFVLNDDLDDCVTDLTFPELRDQKRSLQNILEGWEWNKGWQKLMKAYLASISFADDQLGKLLTALENSPHRDNTIIIVTSDHGYHTGEKNRWFKFSLWERTTRVPLIIKLPGKNNYMKPCHHPVSLIDIYPTLNDLCGLPQNPDFSNGFELDGNSLRVFLEDPESKNWKGSKVALTAKEAIDNGVHYSVKSDRYRYILTSTGQEELYDHQNDKKEWVNLSKIPEYKEVKKNMKKALYNELIP